MTRVHLGLLCLVLASAFYLVRLQYESRTLFAQVAAAEGVHRRLETEREALALQKRTLGTPLRFEKTAREQLGMQPAVPAHILQLDKKSERTVTASDPALKVQP